MVSCKACGVAFSKKEIEEWYTRGSVPSGDDWQVRIVAKCSLCGEPRCYDLPSIEVHAR